ncbi:MAG: ABC transporter permease [Bacteroidetes bacterium]|nr:ABC transporter permease [Bacteroidota bacterium]
MNDLKIKKRHSWQLFSKQDFFELIKFRDLLFTLIKRDVSVVYKQSVIGFGWAVIKPVVQMVIFTFLFTYIAKVQMDDDTIPYTVFNFVALVPFTYFSSALTASTGSLISNEAFITKVYFPRLIIPLVPIIAKLVDFGIAMIVLGFMLFYYHQTQPGSININSNILFLPILIILLMMFSFGISLWFSALAIQYRDLNQIVTFLAQFMMYAAPIVWPFSRLKEISSTLETATGVSGIANVFENIYSFFPLTGIIEGFRTCLIGGNSYSEMPWNLIVNGTIMSLFLLISGIYFFRSKESIFADVA